MKKEGNTGCTGSTDTERCRFVPNLALQMYEKSSAKVFFSRHLRIGKMIMLVNEGDLRVCLWLYMDV